MISVIDVSHPSHVALYCGVTKEDVVGRPVIKYEPRKCQLRHLRVWAIFTSVKEGQWTIVNCLDKEPACEQYGCALISQDGLWPFGDVDPHRLNDGRNNRPV